MIYTQRIDALKAEIQRLENQQDDMQRRPGPRPLPDASVGRGRKDAGGPGQSGLSAEGFLGDWWRRLCSRGLMTQKSKKAGVGRGFGDAALGSISCVNRAQDTSIDPGYIERPILPTARLQDFHHEHERLLELQKMPAQREPSADGAGWTASAHGAWNPSMEPGAEGHPAYSANPERRQFLRNALQFRSPSLHGDVRRTSSRSGGRSFPRLEMEADRLRATLQAEPPVVGTANRSPPGETGWGGASNRRWRRSKCPLDVAGPRAPGADHRG